MDIRRARWADIDPETAYALLKLRVDVFVVEQACPYPELDGRDPDPAVEHVWTADAAGPTAYLRTFAEDGARRIGRIVTRPDARGAGLAARLIADVHARAGATPTVLHAQAHLAGFYGRLGYAVTGPQYLEDGIPHVPMRREP